MKEERASSKVESQETSLDKWGMQLMENILLTAAEALADRKLDSPDSVK